VCWQQNAAAFDDMDANFTASLDASLVGDGYG